MVKLLSWIASLMMVFGFLFPKEIPIVNPRPDYIESVPTSSENRVYDAVNGVGESLFYIERPSDHLRVVYASDFGMKPEKQDNFPEFRNAMLYCKANPGARLYFEPGEYYLKNVSGIDLSGAKDICIDGNGATLIFSQVQDGFYLNRCDCVEFRNITIDWDFDNTPLSDIVIVRNASQKNHVTDLVFPDREFVEEDMILAALDLCDPETLTYGAMRSGKDVYLYNNPVYIRSVRRIENNVLRIVHNGALDRFKDGETCILRHYIYDRTLFRIGDVSRNITFDGLTIYGFPGMGFVFESRCSHFQLLNTKIGVNKEKKYRYTSLGADAIHVVNSNGCFRVESCDISGQGDDALNVHDGLGVVQKRDGNRVWIEANGLSMRQGDILSFKNAAFTDLYVSARIESVQRTSENYVYEVELSDTCPESVKKGCIVRSESYESCNYVIRNNNFHENRGRGCLLQSSDGICENNRFYKTEMQAIKIIMDIKPGLWYEGTGVDNLTVRNNHFEKCDYISTGEVITIGTNIDGKSADGMVFSNIRITGNTFSEYPDKLLSCENCNGLEFSGNKVDAGTTLKKDIFSGRAVFGKTNANIAFKNNKWSNCILGEIAKSENIFLWARINQALK